MMGEHRSIADGSNSENSKHRFFKTDGSCIPRTSSFYPSSPIVTGSIEQTIRIKNVPPVAITKLLPNATKKQFFRRSDHMSIEYPSAHQKRHQPVKRQHFPLPQTITPLSQLPWRNTEEVSITPEMDVSGWNFDPSMLNSLMVGESGNTENCSKMEIKRRTESKATSSTRSSPVRLDSSNWDGNLTLLSSFGELEYEGAGGSSQRFNNADKEDGTHDGGDRSQPAHSFESEQAALIVPKSKQAPRLPSRKESGGLMSAASSCATTDRCNLSQNVGGSQLHPMAIQSSATCPPHSSTSSESSTATGNNPHHLQQSTNGTTPGQPQIAQQADPDFYALEGIDSNAVANLAASFQNTTGSNGSILNSLAANFLLAQIRPSDTTASQTVCQDQQHHGTTVSVSASSQTHSSTSAICSSSSDSQSRHHVHHQSRRKGPSQQQDTKVAEGPNGSTNKAPPFYLFDAPVELRANFMQNQKRLGLPIQHDPNSYHYGETVKGFHPQQLLNQQQLSALVAGGQVNCIPDVPVKLIDARHGYQANLSGRAKNEREQRRAQKITELIDQLRIDMEKGGWKVELRSKFHTLSKCVEYVRHMVNSTKEKEEAIAKLNSDLAATKRKLEEESVQESRSDPESVTSSLTSDTYGTHRHSRSNANKKQKLAQKHPQDNTTSSHNMSSVSMNEESSGGGEDRTSRGSDSGTGSGTRSGTGSGTRSAQGFSIDKTDGTGVSDITDSNRASRSNTCESGNDSGSTESVSRVSEREKRDQGRRSTSSICSDAAVASQKSLPGQEEGEHQHSHKDVVFTHGKRSHRKRSSTEMSSLDKDFELDYEEIFTMSNVPQLIATTSGKVVAWNQCFLRATGIRKSEVERMTIFSLVKPEKLSNFFEIVAHALKDEIRSKSDKNPEPADNGTYNEADDPNIAENDMRASESERPATISPSRADYAAMTLPCVEFPGMRKRRENDGSDKDNQLHVTVTLLADEDPRKRCFHCVFTDCPGTNGALGIITPELLAALFAAPKHPFKKIKGHHHRSRVRLHSGQRKSTHDEIPSSIKQEGHEEEPKVDSETWTERTDQSPADNSS